MAGVLNNTEMRALARNTRAIFYDGLKAAPRDTFIDRLFYVIQSNAREERFAMLRGIPKMRQWVGDRRLKSLSEVSFSIEKKDWEASISINRDDLLFDRLGLVRGQVQALSRSFPRHYTDFVIDLLTNGFARLAYDGQFFFDSDHDRGDGTLYSNKVTGTFDAAAWEAAQAAPVSLMDPESQEFLEIQYTDIFFGSAQRQNVNTVFNVNPLTGGAANPHSGEIPKERQHILRGLGTSKKWFLFDLDEPFKPLVLQVVKGVSFEGFDDPRDWNVWNRKEPVYGIDSIDNAGYGLWELAYASDASAIGG